jgi:hypothetical protein
MVQIDIGHSGGPGPLDYGIALHDEKILFWLHVPTICLISQGDLLDLFRYCLGMQMPALRADAVLFRCHTSCEERTSGNAVEQRCATML